MPYLAIAGGGFIGAILRYLLGEWIGTANGFPIGTLLINTVGCFVLVWLYTITLDKFPIHPHLRLGIGTGLIGAFTTFSTFSVETWDLVKGAFYGMAALYVILTLCLGILFAWLGYVLAHNQTHLRYVGNWDETE